MDVPCEMLLHPELLTSDQLKCIIHQRHLRIPNLQNLPRDELLEIFHQYCLPYGQRKCRDSGRGKTHNQMRRSPESSPAMNTTNNNQTKRPFNVSERIKPPPDMLASYMKKIKLESVNNNKRKIGSDPGSLTSDHPTPPKKNRKPITWP